MKVGTFIPLLILRKLSLSFVVTSMSRPHAAAAGGGDRSSHHGHQVRQRGGGAPHQNWEPLLRTKPDTNPPPKPTKSSVSAVTSPVSSSGTAKVSPAPAVVKPPPYVHPPPAHSSPPGPAPGPPTLVQTVIFDGPKMQAAVQSVTFRFSSSSSTYTCRIFFSRVFLRPAPAPPLPRPPTARATPRGSGHCAAGAGPQLPRPPALGARRRVPRPP